MGSNQLNGDGKNGETHCFMYRIDGGEEDGLEWSTV